MPRQSTRLILLNLFQTREGGFSFGELVTECQRVRGSIHKSTVLRNLRRLVQEGSVVACAQQGRRPIYTSTSPGGHLHAALCRSCTRCLPLPHQTLHKLERLLAEIEGEMSRRGEFVNLEHSVQFEGECAACARTGK